jgi:hypothetical protein
VCVCFEWQVREASLSAFGARKWQRCYARTRTRSRCAPLLCLDWSLLVETVNGKASERLSCNLKRGPACRVEWVCISHPLPRTTPPYTRTHDLTL